MADFTLPELGENIAAGDVLRVLVQPGETLAKDQPVLELETDKATIEVPSTVAGRIKEIKVKAGDKVKVGQAILSVEDGASASAAPSPTKSPSASQAEPAPPPPSPLSSTSLATDNGRQAERGEGAPAERVRAAGTPGLDKVVDFARPSRTAVEPPSPEEPAAPAAPSVRRMARELGVDVNDVVGSGDDGRISIDDVKAHAKRLITAAGVPGGAGAVPHVAAEPLPDFSKWGDVERQPLKGVRRKTAEHLGASWAQIPLVTQYELADISGFEDIRKRYAKQAGEKAAPLTITALSIKIVAAALEVFPQFNVSIDMAAEEIVVKKYIHIGIAVDTDRGLLVPVVRDADKKSLSEVSEELADLAAKARNRKLTLDEMQGATFSISNLGGIGGTAFTPLVNAPEVAILGIARGRIEPVFKDGQFVPRMMLPLALSYDHRAIDGADGARFARWVADVFEQPFLLSLQG
ncbi:MAG TPA: 2-oxo acid dehydrogenase subunit E2 [Vicinamibacterales bacterium]|nr:2-oxo acid dehydrogenase subunit E2 [Vicinamibacterales bacterium]